MRITFVLPSYPKKPTGGFRVVYEYANHLVERGHRVNIVHPRKVKNIPPPPNLYRKLRREIAYFLHKILLNPKPKWQFIDDRVNMLYVPEPTLQYIPDADIIFATFWSLAEYVYEYSENKGEKCYLFQHYETWGGPKEKVDATWKAPFHKVVISKWLYNIGQSLGAKDMVYIPNGINHNHFKILNPIEERKPCVSMMYSEIPWKGAEDGLEALTLTKKRFPNLQTILFGAEKRTRNIPNWIEYRQGPSQESLVKDIYNQSSIYLCPSHAEGFALPPAEAMACGCAVVSTDCGGIRDFAKDGTTALLSSPQNAEILARNLIRLLENDELRIKIAKAGHEQIQQFSWEHSANLFEQFMNVCVNNRKKHSNDKSFNNNS